MEAPYVAANPSLWRDEQGFAAVVRGVNYRLHDALLGWPQDGVFRTRNHLARLDADGRIVSATEMIPAPYLPPALATSVLGFEDCRLFRWRGRLHCSATVRDRNPEMRCEIALLELDDDARIVDVRVLHGHGDDQHQKNWMPAVDGDELLFVYLCDPTTVLRYDPGTGTVRARAPHLPTVALDHLRGGSQLVAFDGGWLCVTHEVAVIDSMRRRYLHRFVYLDREFRVASVTEPFRFADDPIEFVAGLAYDLARDQLLASYGIQDCRAAVAVLDAAAVRRALVTLPGA